MNIIENLTNATETFKNKMQKIYSLDFHREASGRWYIVLPAWPFSHDNLQMVAGADDLLSEIAGETNNNVHITVRLLEGGPNPQIVLTKTGGQYGANYKVAGAKTEDLWLCPVTLFVFKGKYPDKMYISDVSAD